MGEERDLARRALDAGLLGESGEPPPSPAKYELVRQLGSGGAGDVYLARDVDLGRPVALKYLRHARAVEVERFLREARFAARLNNPSIVQVYEAGEVEGLPFIAMQYIGGGNLSSVALTLEETVTVARQVADALVHAHAVGIVHRDIKPENILVDEGKRPYLTDFGIARDLRGELGATISVDGQIMGTPALMPPEQARGDVYAVDERSDVYALGATLFYKLTGRRPFAGDNVVDVLHGVLHADPPYPRSLNPQIPLALEALILRCMKKARGERYPTMAALADALAACLTTRPAERVESPWFASFVRSTVEAAPAAPESEPDETADEDMRPALEFAREIAAWDTGLYRVRANLPRLFPRLDDVIDRLDAVLAKRPGAGWPRYYRGLARFRRGDLDGALDDMERSIDRVRDLSGAYFELGRLYLALFLRDHRLAHQHVTQAGVDISLQEASARLRQARVAFEEAARVGGDGPPWHAQYAVAVGCLAEQDPARCIETCDAILADDPDVEEVWKLRGDAQRLLGADPLESYDRAADVRRSFFEAHLAAAEHLLGEKRIDGARERLDAALAIHPGLTGARVLLARACLDEGRIAEGIEYASAADPGDYDAAVVAAELHLAQDDFAAGLAALERATGLPGCQNRVSILTARALLRRAAAGDADRVLAFRDRMGPEVADESPWREILIEAAALRGR